MFRGNSVGDSMSHAKRAALMSDKNLRAFLDGARDFDNRAAINTRRLSQDEIAAYQQGYLQAAKWTTDGWKKIAVRRSRSCPN